MNYIEENKEKFLEYCNFLIEENKKYNLTSIVEPLEINIKHFEDSISMKDYINLDDIKTLCDVGSGAGFPALLLHSKGCTFQHRELCFLCHSYRRFSR